MVHRDKAKQKSRKHCVNNLSEIRTAPQKAIQINRMMDGKAAKCIVLYKKYFVFSAVDLL